MKEGQLKVKLKEHLWLILGGMIFFILIIQIGLKETWLALKVVNPFYFLGSLILIAIGQQFIPLLKWILMNHKTKMDLDIRKILFFTSHAILGGTITPVRSGEFVAAFMGKGVQGKIASLLLFNRLIESIVTFLIALFVFGFFLKDVISLESWISFGIILGSLLLFFYFLVTKEQLGLWLLTKGQKIFTILGKGKFSKKILDSEKKMTKEVGEFYKSTRKLFSMDTVIFVLLLTILNWALILLANWGIFFSMGVSISLMTVLAVIVLSAIGSFISPTPGGIGLGDIPSAYFLLTQGCQEAGAYLILARFAVYVVAFGWYFLMGKGR